MCCELIRCSVVGLGVGRLGLCIALVMERAGYDVVGVDVFPGYVEALNNKTFRSPEPRVNEFLDSLRTFLLFLSHQMRFRQEYDLI